MRVLHNLSFVEDPTRLLRAIRYEARLGFRMDGHTLSLARGCIEMRLVGDLSSARLRDELLDMLAEPSVVAALERMAELGLDRALHPRLTPGRSAIALVARAASGDGRPPFTRARCDEPLVRLACLCRRMPARRDLRLARASAAPPARPGRGRRARSTLGAAARRAARAAEPPPRPRSFTSCSTASRSRSCSWRSLLAPAGRSAEERIARLPRAASRHAPRDHRRRPEAGGRAASRPRSAGRCSETLALKLDGFVSGRDEELRTAL